MEKPNGLHLALFEGLREAYPLHKMLIGGPSRVRYEIVEGAPVLDIYQRVACISGATGCQDARQIPAGHGVDVCMLRTNIYLGREKAISSDSLAETT